MEFHQEVPDAEAFERLRERLHKDYPKLDKISVHQVNFYLGGGINRAHFAFRARGGSGVYLPKFASIGMAKYISNNEEQAVANLLTDDYYNASSYDIQPGEHLFYGPGGNHERPVWALGFDVMLPYSLAQVVSQFTSRNLERKYSAPGAADFPTIKLWENYFEDGQLKTRNFIKKTLTAAEMKSFSSPIG